MTYQTLLLLVAYSLTNYLVSGKGKPREETGYNLDQEHATLHESNTLAASAAMILQQGKPSGSVDQDDSSGGSLGLLLTIIVIVIAVVLAVLVFCFVKKCGRPSVTYIDEENQE